MLAKYAIEYESPARQHPTPGPRAYYTDDPLACEQFVGEILEQGLRLRSIRHEGTELPRPEFDRMVRLAAGSLAARRICESLGIKPEEERHRFGFAA